MFMSNFIAMSFMLFKNVAKIVDPARCGLLIAVATRIVKFETDFLFN